MHGHDLGVGAAVARALERADGRGVGGIGVGRGARKNAAGEGRVVAAAVLGVEHEHHIEEHCLVVGEVVALAEHLQDGFRHRVGRVGPRDVRPASLELRIAHAVRDGCDARQAGEERERHIDLVRGGDVVGGFVEGVEHENGSREHVHDALGLGGDGELVDVVHGQQALACDARAGGIELVLPR